MKISVVEVGAGDYQKGVPSSAGTSHTLTPRGRAFGFIGRREHVRHCSRRVSIKRQPSMKKSNILEDLHGTRKPIPINSLPNNTVLTSITNKPQEVEVC